VFVVGVQSEMLSAIKTATGGEHCFAHVSRIRRGGEEHAIGLCDYVAAVCVAERDGVFECSISRG
jgi:hypothetical protein